MTPEISDIEAVIREALRKYETGRLEHGQLDLADYCVFQILRLE